LLEDDALEFDTERCDGCGLCAATCPEGAIAHDHEPAVWIGPEDATAFTACERAGLARSDGVISCLHALHLRDLLHLYRQGVRQIVVAHGDCDTCSRGRAPRLEDLLRDLNPALASHGLAPITVRCCAAPDWQGAIARARERATGTKAARRGFLRWAVGTAVEDGFRLAGLLAHEQADFVAAGELLPARQEDGLLPFVPTIDPAECHACNACARLCPHAAIRLERGESSAHYAIEAERCSGCGLCVDVCDVDAVTMQRWQPQPSTPIQLESGRCHSCGAPFSVPEGMMPADHRCRICRQTNHHRNLFQVLE
jgi:Pyruvate/2-oxoacid:ferredoxin oxidoreductase delta subunit